MREAIEKLITEIRELRENVAKQGLQLQTTGAKVAAGAQITAFNYIIVRLEEALEIHETGDTGITPDHERNRGVE